MGIFNCCECDNLADSDDGCMRCKVCKNEWICDSCAYNMSNAEYKEKVGEKL